MKPCSSVPPAEREVWPEKRQYFREERHGRGLVRKAGINFTIHGPTNLIAKLMPSLAHGTTALSLYSEVLVKLSSLPGHTSRSVGGTELHSSEFQVSETKKPMRG